MLKMRLRTWILLISFVIFSSGCLTNDVIQGERDIAFEIIVNNTNLAPTFAGETPGTGERNDSVTYYANISAIQLMVWAHATTSGQNSEIHMYINGTKVADTSGRPLGLAESSNKTIVALIPKYASYMVEFSNYHHYEWREYPILSGRNGTLNYYNITNITTTGGSGVSDLANLTINTNKDWMNYSITNVSLPSDNSKVTCPALACAGRSPVGISNAGAYTSLATSARHCLVS